MKHIFIDTNIMLDYLANRMPFAKDAMRILDYSKKKKIHIYLSSLSYHQINYILRKQYSKQQTKSILNNIFKWTNCLSINSDIVKQSLDAEMNDFEDALQYYTAIKSGNIHCIVTRNKRDFTSSIIPVLSPKEYLTWLN